MSAMEALRREVLGLLAQGAVFLVGLVVSLTVGILLAAQTDGPGLLILVTLIAGIGLLGAAVLSQQVHDRIAFGDDPEDP